MRISCSHRTFTTTFAVLLAGIAAMIIAPQAVAANPTIEFEIVKAGFIIGGSGGSGVLTYEGKTYPLKIGGVSLGATIGVSKAELAGEVLNLKSLADIEGTYSATQAGLAVAGGNKVAELKNGKGVIIKVKGKQIGLEIALDLSGLEIGLKKQK
jgi:hypothetical protein